MRKAAARAACGLAKAIFTTTQPTKPGLLPQGVIADKCSRSGATWRSGYATVCKTVYTSSILVVASINLFSRLCAFHKNLAENVRPAGRSRRNISPHQDLITGTIRARSRTAWRLCSARVGRRAAVRFAESLICGGHSDSTEGAKRASPVAPLWILAHVFHGSSSE